MGTPLISSPLIVCQKYSCPGRLGPIMAQWAGLPCLDQTQSKIPSINLHISHSREIENFIKRAWRTCAAGAGLYKLHQSVSGVMACFPRVPGICMAPWSRYIPILMTDVPVNISIISITRPPSHHVTPHPQHWGH